MSASRREREGKQVADGPASDRPGHVEVRGIDYVEQSERHGKASELFAVWFSSNLSYLYILFGGLLILFGLTLVQAIVVVLVGNLFYLTVGAIATAGPKFGTSTVNISRLMFGSKGNVLLGAFPARSPSRRRSTACPRGDGGRDTRGRPRHRAPATPRPERGSCSAS